MADGTEVFDIIHSTRSMRRLKPDPVTEELIRRILISEPNRANQGRVLNVMRLYWRANMDKGNSGNPRDDALNRWVQRGLYGKPGDSPSTGN